MRRLHKIRFRFLKEQTGFSLIETVIAVAILAFIGVTFLSALSTISKSDDLYEQQVMAQSLMQSQLERLKASDYDSSGNYSSAAVAPVPPSYKISISAVETENVTGKQEITVTVSRGGHHVLELTTIKAQW